jgi:hypothetical protein
MMFVPPAQAASIEGVVWDQLATFGTLPQAEFFVDHPPPDLGDPGMVTIERDLGGNYCVLSARRVTR